MQSLVSQYQTQHQVQGMTHRNQISSWGFGIMCQTHFSQAVWEHFANWDQTGSNLPFGHAGEPVGTASWPMIYVHDYVHSSHTLKPHIDRATKKLSPAYDSLSPATTPVLDDFFRSYFLIQGCTSTSESGNLSSGLYFSSWKFSRVNAEYWMYDRWNLPCGSSLLLLVRQFLGCASRLGRSGDKLLPVISFTSPINSIKTDQCGQRDPIPSS